MLSSPPLCPPVLKPCLDLRVGHLEPLGERGALRGGQVLLLVEALLQLADLDAAERGARLLALGRGAVLVRVADATTGKGERTWRKKKVIY